MKLRDLVILVAALALLSAVLGTAVLVYLYVWRVPAAAPQVPPSETMTPPAVASPQELLTPLSLLLFPYIQPSSAHPVVASFQQY